MYRTCDCCCHSYYHRVAKALFELGFSVLSFAIVENGSRIVKRVHPETYTDASNSILFDLKPCECQFGNPILTGLSGKAYWCICPLETTLLRAFEEEYRKTIEDTSHMFAIRTTFYGCAICKL
jgi:hypothetical protein